MTGDWEIDINERRSIICYTSPKNPIRLIPLHLNVTAKISMPYECYSSIWTSRLDTNSDIIMGDSDKEFTLIPSVDGTARSQGKSHVSCKATKS